MVNFKKKSKFFRLQNLTHYKILNTLQNLILLFKFKKKSKFFRLPNLIHYKILNTLKNLILLFKF